tara:strand:+ start:1178 stop:1351 length:174 start_codon:yes stop_codon:yes gene_type:complete
MNRWHPIDVVSDFNRRGGLGEQIAPRGPKQKPVGDFNCRSEKSMRDARRLSAKARAA